MIEIDEALLLILPPRLSCITPAVKRVLAWCRLHGVSPEDLARIELPLVEAVNNAVEYGCADRPGATVKITARVAPDAIVATVCDPGEFTPPANWTELPEDPLAEGGRGGFIIHTNTDLWHHANTPEGHVLTLRWNASPLAGRGLEAAAEAETDIGRLTEDLANSFETLLGLTHFAGLLATSASFDQLLDKVHERLRTMLAHDSLLIRFVNDGKLVYHPLGASLSVPVGLPLDARFAESMCASHHRSLVGSRADLPPGDPLAGFAARVCVLTVEFGGKILGTLVAARGHGAAAFSAGEVELLQAVADFVGIAKATDNLWRERNQQLRLEQEIQVAAGIQRSLLPASFPAGGRWWVHGECRPAREVGGDYFDVVPLPDGSLLLLIADVMGKGVPASLLAAMLRSSLRALAAVESSPGAILTGINHQLFPDLVALGMFITAVLVKLPAARDETPVFANAGHCPPAILRRDGGIIEPKDGEAPLGVLPDTDFPDHPLPLGPADRLLLYTDGCYELPGPGGSGMLGSDRYLCFASALLHLTPPDYVSALLDPIALRLDPEDIADDRTLLVASPRP
jgi:serine phosphatase RsbU (regulator of sigma subunit)/anti-sigma regulatory factor (Ser/Thr protein kinase)